MRISRTTVQGVQCRTQRIEVIADGIVVTVATEALISTLGKVMEPAIVNAIELPWAEVYRASLARFDYGSGSQPELTLTIDLTWGEWLEVSESDEGFDEAVTAIAARFGRPLPDLAGIGPDHVDL